MTERYPVIFADPGSGVIWSPVHQGISHRADNAVEVKHRRRTNIEEADYSAHIVMRPSMLTEMPSGELQAIAPGASLSCAARDATQRGCKRGRHDRNIIPF